MGISGLLQGLKPFTENRNVRDFSQQTLAIDVSSWLHKSVYSIAADYVEAMERQSEHLCNKSVSTSAKYVVKRCQELLQFAHVQHLYLVLDGTRCPLKAPTNHERERKRQQALEQARSFRRKKGQESKIFEKYTQCIKITSPFTQAVMQKVMDELPGKPVTMIQSPYEADAQLVQLCVSQKAHCIVTEDSDVLVYMAACRIVAPVLFKLDRQSGSCQVINMAWLLDSMERTRLFNLYNTSKVSVSSLELLLIGWMKLEQSNAGTGIRLFIQACILSGCDYAPNVLPGIGLVSAFKLVDRQYRSDSRRSGQLLLHEQRFAAILEQYQQQHAASRTMRSNTAATGDLTEYEMLLAQSEAVFYHHPVRKEQGVVEYLNPLSTGPSLGRFGSNLDFLGKVEQPSTVASPPELAAAEPTISHPLVSLFVTNPKNPGHAQSRTSSTTTRQQSRQTNPLAADEALGWAVQQQLPKANAIHSQNELAAKARDPTENIDQPAPPVLEISFYQSKKNRKRQISETTTQATKIISSVSVRINPYQQRRPLSILHPPCDVNPFGAYKAGRSDAMVKGRHDRHDGAYDMSAIIRQSRMPDQFEDAARSSAGKENNSSCHDQQSTSREFELVPLKHSALQTKSTTVIHEFLRSHKRCSGGSASNLKDIRYVKPRRDDVLNPGTMHCDKKRRNKSDQFGLLAATDNQEQRFSSLAGYDESAEHDGFERHNSQAPVEFGFRRLETRSYQKGRVSLGTQYCNKALNGPPMNQFDSDLYQKGQFALEPHCDEAADNPTVSRFESGPRLRQGNNLPLLGHRRETWVEEHDFGKLNDPATGFEGPPGHQEHQNNFMRGDVHVGSEDVCQNDTRESNLSFDSQINLSRCNGDLPGFQSSNEQAILAFDYRDEQEGHRPTVQSTMIHNPNAENEVEEISSPESFGLPVGLDNSCSATMPCYVNTSTESPPVGSLKQKAPPARRVTLEEPSGRFGRKQSEVAVQPIFHVDLPCRDALSPLQVFDMYDEFLSPQKERQDCWREEDDIINSSPEQVSHASPIILDNSLPLEPPPKPKSTIGPAKTLRYRFNSAGGSTATSRSSQASSKGGLLAKAFARQRKRHEFEFGDISPTFNIGHNRSPCPSSFEHLPRQREPVAGRHKRPKRSCQTTILSHFGAP